MGAFLKYYIITESGELQTLYTSEILLQSYLGDNPEYRNHPWANGLVFTESEFLNLGN